MNNKKREEIFHLVAGLDGPCLVDIRSSLHSRVNQCSAWCVADMVKYQVLLLSVVDMYLVSSCGSTWYPWLVLSWRLRSWLVWEVSRSCLIDVLSLPVSLSCHYRQPHRSNQNIEYLSVILCKLIIHLNCFLRSLFKAYISRGARSTVTSVNHQQTKYQVKNKKEKKYFT